jgi:hypothetical protein
MSQAEFSDQLFRIICSSYAIIIHFLSTICYKE